MDQNTQNQTNNQTNTNNAQSTPPVSNPSNAAPKGNAIAILCYLGILIIIPFLTDSKNDPFVKFHIKQGLVLIISWVVQMIISVIPILGWVVGFILCIFNFVLLIIGIVNVLSGKEKELPLIGKYASKFNI